MKLLAPPCSVLLVHDRVPFMVSLQFHIHMDQDYQPRILRHLALFSERWSMCNNSCREPLRGFSIFASENVRCGFKNRTQQLWLLGWQRHWCRPKFLTRSQSSQNSLKLKLLYFEWSPSWHFKSYFLTYILTFYLTFYLTSILIFYLSSSILSGIYFGVLSGIYSGILCGILSRIYFGILCGMYSGSLSGIYSGIPSGRWGPAVPTELGRSQVEVQRCVVILHGVSTRWVTCADARRENNLWQDPKEQAGKPTSADACQTHSIYASIPPIPPMTNEVQDGKGPSSFPSDRGDTYRVASHLSISLQSRLVRHSCCVAR